MGLLKGVGVYPTLLLSDTVHPYGRAKSDTRPVGVDLRKMTIVVMGRVGVCMLLYYSQIYYSHMVVQNQVRDMWGLCGG